MNAESPMHTAPSISGHMLTLGAGHSIAIYERNRYFYVAEFRDGHGELMSAATWFHFHAGGLRYCHNRRRSVLESSMPLTPEMLVIIERLHRESEARQERMLAAPWTVAAAALRYLVSAMSRLRGSMSKTSQTLG